MSGHQCTQTLPLSTRLTTRPIWDKTKKVTCEIRRISCMKSVTKDHLLPGMVRPMFAFIVEKPFHILNYYKLSIVVLFVYCLLQY